MNLFELFVKIGVDDQASKKISSLTSKLGGGLSKAAKVGAAAVGAVTAATGALNTGITVAAGSVASYGDNIDKMSQKMGMSAEAYQEWDAVMQHSGTSIESLQAGMKTLANAVENGNDAFNRLGISQEEIAKMSNEELFSATITALQNVENETERTYLAGQLLGRGATELGALLNTSAEDTQAMKDRVHELGGVMSDEAVKAAARYQDSLQDMKTSFSGLKNNLIGDFLPGLSTVMDGIASLVTGENGAQSTISSGISQILESINSSLPRIFDAGKQIVEAIFQSITQNSHQMASGVTEILMSLVDGIITNLPALVDLASEIIINFVDNITAKSDVIFESGSEIVYNLIYGISKFAEKLIPAATDLVVSFSKQLSHPSTLQFIVEDAVKIVSSLVNGLMDAIPALLQAAPVIIGNLVAGLIVTLPQVIGAGIEILMSLVNGILDAIPSLVAAIPTITMAIVNGILTNLDEIILAAIQITLSIAMGMIEAIPNMITQLPRIFLAIVNAFKEFNWKDIGSNLLTGIWNGINDKVEWLKGKVQGVVDKIKGWFTGKDGFDEHSPSKWSKKVFQYVMDGGANGIDAGMPGMMSAVSGAVNSIKSGFDVGTISARASASGSAQNSVRAAIHEEISKIGIYLDGNTLVGGISDRMNQGLGSIYAGNERRAMA